MLPCYIFARTNPHPRSQVCAKQAIVLGRVKALAAVLCTNTDEAVAIIGKNRELLKPVREKPASPYMCRDIDISLVRVPVVFRSLSAGDMTSTCPLPKPDIV